MTETLARPESHAEGDDTATATLDELLESQSVEAVQQTPEQREVSPTGSLLVRAATRVSTMLERRAVNKAHTEALKEYRQRDHDGYIEHVTGLTESTGDGVSAEADAFAQITLEREQFKANTHEAYEDAKDRLKTVGRSALSKLAAGGAVTAGIVILGAEAAGRGAKKLDSTFTTGMDTLLDKRDQLASSTLDGVRKFGEVTGDGFMAGMGKVEAGLDTIDAKVTTYQHNRETRRFNRQMEADSKAAERALKRDEKQLDKDRKFQAKQDAKQDKRDEKQLTRDKKDYLKILDQKERADARAARKEAATARRAERRNRWASKLNAVRETLSSGVESGRQKASEIGERATEKTHLYRSAGRQALRVYRETLEASKTK